MDADPVKQLREGRALLAPILEAAGFKWHEGAFGNSSGGSFASGEYVRGDRRLELHFIYSLGMVTYHLGDLSLDHEQLMRHTGHRAQAKYPGFAKDPLAAFRDLSEDLSRFGADFLEGTGAEFREAYAASKQYEKQGGFERMSNNDL